MDHIRPISRGGGRLDPNNLRSVCRQHHDRLTANLRKFGINELHVGRRGADVLNQATSLDEEDA